MKLVNRSPADRRCGKERRKRVHIQRFLRKAEALESDRRIGSERRSSVERRSGWVRIGKWASVCLEKLKIAKFLR